MKNIKFEELGSSAAIKLELNPDDLIQMIKQVIIETTNSVVAKLNQERSPEFMTRKEAMKRLEVKSEATMINWEKKDYLRPHRIGGRVFYRQDEIVDALERFERPNECLI